MRTITSDAPSQSGGMRIGNLMSSLGEAGRLHPVVWIYLLAVVLPVGLNLGPLALTGLRAMLLIMVVPLSVRLFTGKYGKVYPVDILFYLHVFWIAVAVGVNNPNRAIENVGSTAVEFIGGYVIGRAFIRNRSDMFGLIKAIFLLFISTLPFALIESKTGTAIIPYVIDRIPGLTTVAQVTIEKRMGLHRVQNSFPHPIHYGLFCSTALALTFVGLRNVLSLGARIARTAAICVGIFLSLSSGALLAAVLQLGLIAWDTALKNVAKRWLVLLGIFALMYVAVDILSNRSPVRVLMSYATFSAHTAFYRSIIFEWGMMNVWDNKIFGLGLRDWIRPSYMRSGSMDNFWLVMAVRYGIPGFLLIALGYADALIRVGRRPFTPGSVHSNLRLAWMIMFTCLSFTLVTVHIWTNVYSYVFFMLGAGLWLAGATDEDAAGAEVPETPGRSRSAPAARRPVQSYARVTDGLADGSAGLSRPPVEATEPAKPARNRAGTDKPPAQRRAQAFTRFPGSGAQDKRRKP